MTAKRILLILSTIASIVFVFPFSIYFGALGVMFLTFAESVSSIIDVIYIISGVFYLSTPILCIVGIILSFIFIAKEKYKKGFMIQLLPFASVISGVFMMVVSMIFGNP